MIDEGNDSDLVNDFLEGIDANNDINGNSNDGKNNSNNKNNANFDDSVTMEAV